MPYSTAKRSFRAPQQLCGAKVSLLNGRGRCCTGEPDCATVLHHRLQRFIPAFPQTRIGFRLQTPGTASLVEFSA